MSVRKANSGSQGPANGSEKVEMSSNQDKKERRVVRQELLKVVMLRHFSLDARMGMTPKQLKAAARVVVDKLIAGKNPKEAVALA